MCLSAPLAPSTAYSDPTAPSLAHGSAQVANATRLPDGDTANDDRGALPDSGMATGLPPASLKPVVIAGSPSHDASMPVTGRSAVTSSAVTWTRGPSSAGVAVFAALPVARSIENVVGAPRPQRPCAAKVVTRSWSPTP